MINNDNKQVNKNFKYIKLPENYKNKAFPKIKPVK